MRPTIKDVARLSGFSISTVSLVLNNKGKDIPPATCQKVLRAAKELNYRPNRLAVSLVTRRSNIIGLILPDNSNQFFALLGSSIESETRRHGYSVIFGYTRNEPARDAEYIQMFTDRGIDGILLIKSTGRNAAENTAVIELLLSTGIPFVLIDRYESDPRVTTVMLDHYKGAYLGTKHLIDCGHTRIGCVSGPQYLETSRKRISGYRAALADAGIAADDSLLIEGNTQIDSGYAALRPLLSRGATAIFAGNDLMAFGLYRAAREVGCRIPDDLSVVGFDATHYGQLVSPPLTSVWQPIPEIATEAVRLLIERIERKGEPMPAVHKVFEPTLSINGSTRSLLPAQP